LIVWLASWPRCGNTLLRLIIERCFEIPTYSVYPERKLDWLFGERAISLGENWCPEKHQELKNDDDLYCIKTHQVIEDDSPIIYIARDGRDACASLGHFWELPVQQIITAKKINIGTVSIGSWSEHFLSYLPKFKTNSSSIIKFEDMIESPDLIANLISFYLKTKPIREYENNFAELQSKQPAMFRKGKAGSWREEFSREEENVFWHRHGEAMRLLGYA
jgi:hypothetical protein